jgi:hypothetical protein
MLAARDRIHLGLSRIHTLSSQIYPWASARRGLAVATSATVELDLDGGGHATRQGHDGTNGWFATIRAWA